jgi:multiple sugar transport system substrate-binding protein
MQRFFLAVSILSISLLLASCGDGIPSKYESRITLWVMPNTPDPDKDLKRLLKGFELENPGVKVEIAVLDWGSAWTKITTAATAKTGPDLVQLPTTWAASITEMGALISLDSLLAEIGGPSKYMEASLEYAKPRASDSVTSLPWFLDVRPAFYRKDVLSRLDIDPETVVSWEAFSATLLKIKSANMSIEGTEVEPMAYPGKNDWNVIHNFAPWIWGAGGSFLNATATASNIGSDESIRGIMFYLNLVRQGYNKKKNLEKNTAQVSADFDEGRSSFWFDATTKTIYLQRPQFLGGTGQTVAGRNYGVMLPPTSPIRREPYYFIGGSNLAVFNFSKNKNEALKLLRYLAGRKQTQLRFARMSGFLPSLKESFADNYFTENPDNRVFLEMVKRGRPYPSVHYWGEIETSILMRRFGNIFDLITESKDGVWPEAEIINEIKETDKEITRYITNQLDKNPKLKTKLLEYRSLYE